MLLYLLRHANADTMAPSDSLRPLSPKGVAQALRIGQFCKTHDLQPELILTSPFLRTRQTAEHLTSVLKDIPLEVAPFLASGMDPESAVDELRAYKKLSSLMIVGHEPDLSLLIARLIGLVDNANLHICKGSLTLLQVTSWSTAASILEFSLPCRLM